jgi:protein-tyrosine kinase
MTIVETALQRARELVSRPPAPGEFSVAHTIARPGPQVAAVADIQPHLKIRAKSLPVDVEACRENRLLLDSSDERDAGIVAAYRMLRTRILHRVRAKKWTTIGITSAGPNDGKTLTALNLCFSLAREKNSEVVLLDLDMRNPSVCRSLGVQPVRELRDFFERSSETQDLFFSVGVDNLILAGQNTPTGMASELLGSTRFEDLTSHIRQSTSNPIVIVDLPPVLVTDDALVLAPRLDALLLVASEGRTDRADLQKATDLLSEFSMLGLVLNRSTERSSSYGYGYGYGSGYGTKSKK